MFFKVSTALFALGVFDLQPADRFGRHTQTGDGLGGAGAVDAAVIAAQRFSKIGTRAGFGKGRFEIVEAFESAQHVVDPHDEFVRLQISSYALLEPGAGWQQGSRELLGQIGLCAETADVFAFQLCHQMSHSDVVSDAAVHELALVVVLLCYAGTEAGKPGFVAQVFFSVYRGADGRSLDRHQLFEKIRPVLLHVVDDRGAERGDVPVARAFLHIFHVSPQHDVSAKSGVVDFGYAQRTQVTKHMGGFVRVQDVEGGGDDQGYFFTCGQIFKEALRVVGKFAGEVAADGNTMAAVDALVSVHFDAADSVPQHGNIGAWDWTFRNAAMAAYALVVCKDQSSFDVRHILSLYSKTAASIVWLKWA